MFPTGVTHHLKVFLNKKDPKIIKVQLLSFLLPSTCHQHRHAATTRARQKVEAVWKMVVGF